MTISTTLNRTSSVGNGTAAAIPFPYKFLADSDLVVIEVINATGAQTTKALTTDYTVSGAGDDAGGSITPTAVRPSTVTWVIYRDPERTQSTDWVENDSLSAETLEDAFDKAAMIDQRLADLVNRSVRQPEGDTTDIEPIPAKVERASKYAAYNADGDPIAAEGTADATVHSAFIATLHDDADAAEARTTLGLGTAAVKNTGTSGDAVPLLNGTNVWSGTQTVTRASADAELRVLRTTTSTADGRVQATSTGVRAGSFDATPVLLMQNGTEAGRIDLSKNLLWAQSTSTDPADDNTVGGALLASGTLSVNAAGAALRVGRSADGSLVTFFSGGTVQGSISISGATTSYNTSSDVRLKENIAPLADALSVCRAVEAKEFEFTSQPGKRLPGFLAQQLLTIPALAHAVHQDEVTGFLGVDYSKLVPHLIAAMQEMATRLEALESKP